MVLLVYIIIMAFGFVIPIDSLQWVPNCYIIPTCTYAFVQGLFLVVMWVCGWVISNQMSIS